MDDVQAASRDGMPRVENAPEGARSNTNITRRLLAECGVRRLCVILRETNNRHGLAKMLKISLKMS